MTAKRRQARDGSNCPRTTARALAGTGLFRTGKAWRLQRGNLDFHGHLEVACRACVVVDFERCSPRELMVLAALAFTSPRSCTVRRVQLARSRPGGSQGTQVAYMCLAGQLTALRPDAVPALIIRADDFN